MRAAVLVAIGTVAMLLDWHSGAGRFAGVQRRTVAAENFHGRPFRQNGDWRWRVRGELLRRVDNLSADNGENRFDAFDLFFYR